MIFLPVNLSSSIFGMNVTVINSETTPIAAFIVTAIVLFVSSLCIWAGSSILLRYQKLAQHNNPDLGIYYRERQSQLIRMAIISWWKRENPLNTLNPTSIHESDKLG